MTGFWVIRHGEGLPLTMEQTRVINTFRDLTSPPEMRN